MENNNKLIKTSNSIAESVQSYIQNLPDKLKPFIELKNSPRYNELTDSQRKDFCVDAITVMFADTGVAKDKIDYETLKFQSLNQLYPELNKSQFSFLTLAEISKALHMGVRRDFGPYMGLNAVTYNHFLKGFMAIPERAEAMKELNKIAYTPPEKIYTQSEKDMEMIKYALIAFYDFKAGKDIGQYIWRFYSFLSDRLGTDYVNSKGVTVKTLISDNAQREQITKTAKSKYEKYVNDYSKELTAKGRYKEARALKACLENLELNMTYTKYIRNEALLMYFNNLVSNNIDLKTLLESHGSK